MSRALDIFLRNLVLTAVSNIGRNGVVKYHNFLTYEGDLFTQACERNFALRNPVEINFSLGRRPESRNEVDER